MVIETNLAYQNAAAAGTGIVLTSSGRILTNNHVIAGATTIRVVVPKTTHTYTARVVGYDTTADVAVLQLQKASHLKTVKTGNASSLKLGARVTAVGNAGGTGKLTSSRGNVTGLNRSITVQGDNGTTRTAHRAHRDERTAPARRLRRAAAEQRGPCGRNRHGRIERSPFASASNDGYAIPIGEGNDDREADRVGQVVDDGAHRRHRVPGRATWEQRLPLGARAQRSSTSSPEHQRQRRDSFPAM